MTNKDLERTIYMAETYIGRPFSTTELNSFCYINDQLHFSSDLLEYLIEYCVTRGKKSVRYIESVAINWYQQGITSVQEAKEQSTLYSQNVFPIMKAFGISNRDPGSAELDYIKKWNSLGLGTDIRSGADTAVMLLNRVISDFCILILVRPVPGAQSCLLKLSDFFQMLLILCLRKMILPCLIFPPA